MAIQNISENVIVVTLPKNQQRSEELTAINEIVNDKGGCDVIIDFCRVEIVTSADICNLLILHKLLIELGHRLILCNVAFATKCIFSVTGLDKVFEFVDDKPVALKTIESPL